MQTLLYAEPSRFGDVPRKLLQDKHACAEHASPRMCSLSWALTGRLAVLRSILCPVVSKPLQSLPSPLEYGQSLVRVRRAASSRLFDQCRANLVCPNLLRDFELVSGLVSNRFADFHQAHSVMTFLKVIVSDTSDSLVDVVQLSSWTNSASF